MIEFILAGAVYIGQLLLFLIIFGAALCVLLVGIIIRDIANCVRIRRERCGQLRRP